MATQQKKNNGKPTIEDYWWLLRTNNPDGSKNQTITVISNVYCLADFKGMELSEVEEKCNIKSGYFKKILDDTEKTWNDKTIPVSKQVLPEISDELVEKLSQLFYVTETTLRETPLSPEFYYYTFGKPTSLNIKESNEENMKLVLFLEKISMDCLNYVFNIQVFKNGDPNHFGTQYEVANVDNPDYKFKIQKDESGSIIITVGNVINGTLIFSNNSDDVVYPVACRMENVLYESAIRDAKCRKITQIPTNVLGIMTDFLDNIKRDPIDDKKSEEILLEDESQEVKNDPENYKSAEKVEENENQTRKPISVG